MPFISNQEWKIGKQISSLLKNMTTSILAQKLLSVKLGKAEFEKIKWMRYNTMERKHKATSYLKQVIDQQINNKMCRLCLNPGGTEIFGNTQDLVNNIKQIFGIEIYESDGKPQHICKSCATTVEKAAELKQTAETTQWRLQQELDMVTETSDWEPSVPLKHHGGYFVEKEMKIVREWSCSGCKRTFANQEEFNAHEKTKGCKKTKRIFVCERCGIELKTVTRLKRHRLTHNGEFQFACAHCPYRARTKYALIVHERSHTGDRPIRCPYCTATFPNSSNLSSHKRKHFPPAYHCHLCKKGFKFKETLQNHMATQHSNAKPFTCTVCAKAFSTRKLLRRHELKIHNRPKMRSGILPSYLKQHEDLT